MSIIDYEQLFAEVKKPPPGWDADDPNGCWMKDGPKASGIDYTDGFRLFESFFKAIDYAATLEYHVLGYDSEVSLWTVTPLNGPYGC